VSEAVSREQLKQIMIRFLEIALTKIIWTPVDQDRVWSSFKDISCHLAVLMERNMINKDELDYFFKSLLESFCRFLDLAGTELSDPLLETMKNEIISNSLLVCSLEEQEQQLQSKADRLLEVLWMVKARKVAQEKGMLVEPLERRSP
jgi:hypothetical protein